MSSDPTSEDPGSGAITRLLERAAAGDATAADGLLPMVYERLREIARRQLAGESGQHTLSPTDLVHEAFLSFHREDGLPAWNDRAHFFRYAATAMRHILVSRARKRLADKRGGGVVALDLDEVQVLATDASATLVALDNALRELESLNPRLAQVVEMRFFAGLPVEDVAKALGIAERSVVRDWRRARAFLHAHLGHAPDSDV
jgi:RNA polymerase sigma factor (TIGR02999 family)